MRLLLSIFLILLVNAACNNAVYSAIFPGIHNSSTTHKLNPGQLMQLAAELRLATGLTDLSFETAGMLIAGTRIEGGSAEARRLLANALSSGKRFEIENYEGSPDIAFARISAGEDLVENGVRLTVYRIQLDFADFKCLSGDQRAQAAFGVGLNVLHELTHGALGLMDPTNGAPIEGDCERIVNRIRAELNLPRRAKYDPELTVSLLSSGSRLVQASLFFIEETGEKRKLTWLASRVAPNAAYADGRLSWRTSVGRK